MQRGEKMKTRKKRYVRRLDEEKLLRHNLNSLLDAETNVLELDEIEALRLVDYEGLSQIEAGLEMNVSRGTIQRLLEKARKKLVDSILNNKHIRTSNNISDVKLKGENNFAFRSNNLKIAFPSSDKVTIDDHYTHTREFAIYEINQFEVTHVNYLSPNLLRPSIFPISLKAQGVDVVIAKKMNARAINLFKNEQIDVILGASGRIDVNLNEYLAGYFIDDAICDTE